MNDVSEIGFFELPSEPPTDVRQGLFNILKSIIDGEWGPYTDEYYWEMVADAMGYLMAQAKKIDFDEPEYEGAGAPHGWCYVIPAD